VGAYISFDLLDLDGSSLRAAHLDRVVAIVPEQGEDGEFLPDVAHPLPDAATVSTGSLLHPCLPGRPAADVRALIARRSPFRLHLSARLCAAADPSAGPDPA
jgi:hypothetical protein